MTISFTVTANLLLKVQLSDIKDSVIHITGKKAKASAKWLIRQGFLINEPFRGTKCPPACGSPHAKYEGVCVSDPDPNTWYWTDMYRVGDEGKKILSVFNGDKKKIAEFLKRLDVVSEI